MSLEQDQAHEVAFLTVLTVNNVVPFPGMTKSLLFRSSVSINALRGLAPGQKVFLVTHRHPERDQLDLSDLHEVGVIGEITKRSQLANGSIQVVFRGDQRGSLLTLEEPAPFLRGRIKILRTRESADSELPQLVEALKSEFQTYVANNSGTFQVDPGFDERHLMPGQLADAIAPLLKTTLDEKQQVLATLDTRERVELVYTQLYKEIRQREYERNLKSRVEERVGKRQKEYFLNEQMRAIRDEMGESEVSELEELAEKIRQAKMPDHAREVAEKELKRLRGMADQSHEATPVRNYLDWLISVPWHEQTADNLSIKNARAILEADHYGLDKPKERIVEYIAVLNAVGRIRGSIVCLSGPPGVGKTSLAQSIARALGRKFARISLGGVRDEAEIRGHRRTYVGALPGKLIQTMKKVGTTNPLILLDEIDKISNYWGGGPTSALLEVLDPEQNHAFADHYLEVDYDLSNVLFICTANDLSTVPLPLRDRMEIIELSGYTELEKLQIARRFLIPKQMENTGLKEGQLAISDSEILDVIRGYTREAGVRTLERSLAKLCRKAVTERLEREQDRPIRLTPKRLQRYLGVPRFQHGKIEKTSEVGFINGLAWTSVGGETLSIEATVMKGTGKIALTGTLGDVMKESAHAAISYVRSHANSLGIYSRVFRDHDIHIHVPAGGTPKDGPSAGIALAVAIVSALTRIPIHWDVALTGEVTLRGTVLPIGGLKEKLLAANRANMRTVVIPHENLKDLAEIPAEIKRGLEIVAVKHLSEVFPLLLEHLPIEVDDAQDPDAKALTTLTYAEEPHPAQGPMLD